VNAHNVPHKQTVGYLKRQDRRGLQQVLFYMFILRTSLATACGTGETKG